MAVSPSGGHYEVLGVTPDASQEEVRVAYRRLARSAHPDVNHGDGERFRRIAEAYEVLRDPARRARFDRDQATRAALEPPNHEAPHGPVASRRAPGPTGGAKTERARDRAAWEQARAVAEAPAPAAGEPQAAPRDEWSFVVRAGIWLAVAVVVAVLVLLLLTAVLGGEPSSNGADIDMAIPAMCRTPDGWVDCRALVPQG